MATNTQFSFIHFISLFLYLFGFVCCGWPFPY
jgi:hypothetical protein